MKLILLTGFLGAGKTTLLNQLLKAFDGHKIGVLMNEFGDISVDGALIKSTKSINLLEITGGSIFCACLKENFIEGLAKLLEYDLEYVFVETSGVADPSNIGTILSLVEKLTGKRYDYRGSLCIVDALNFEETCDNLPALKRQIAYASAVIINKVDLQTREDIETIKNMIRIINSTATIVEAIYCAVDIPNLLGHIPRQPQFQENISTWWRPKTIRIMSKEELRYVDFQKMLRDLALSAYRIKGFARTDHGPVMVNAVNEQIDIQPWHKRVETTELVVISSIGIKIINLALTLWQRDLGDIQIDLK